MATAVDTITSYAKKDVQGRNGKFTMTMFQTQSGREYATSKGEIASQAVLLMNQPVEIEHEVVQKGDYTNYYLQGVKTVNGAAPVPQTDPGPSVAPQSDREDAIARAVALKAAVDTLPSLADIIKDDAYAGKVRDPAEVLALAEFYLTWLKGE